MKVATQILDSNKFGKIDLNDILQFESTNDIILPSDYKDFLIQHNGGRPYPAITPSVKSDVQWIYGMIKEPNYASLFHHIDIYQHRIPSWYIPIANDSGGNLYIMSLYRDNHGLIAFWHHEQESQEDADQYFDNVSVVANSFSEFLQQLVEKL